MFLKELCVVVVLSILLTLYPFVKTDVPCASRSVTGQSVVCVCNATYCDELGWEAPAADTFVAYTSSEKGSRFKKSNGTLKSTSSSSKWSELSTSYTIAILKDFLYNAKIMIHRLELDPTTTYQTVKGFGGAVTDAAGIHWKNISQALQNYLINSYYGPNGNQYNMIRVPIGGTDFSTHAYAYNEVPENDAKLSNYSLAYEDYEYKIPMIKAIIEASDEPIHIVATTWSPPVWMKTNNAFYGASRLKTEYYQTYADYHYKFLEKYAQEGINMWAITTTNEPINGIVPLARFNSLGWTPNAMGQWLVNNLGPTIRNSTFKDLKILTGDDQRYTIPLWFNKMISDHPKALDVIDGVAVHYYGDIYTPPAILSAVSKEHPDKFVIATEACEGSYPWELEKVIIGSWQRAKSYIQDILEDLNYNVVGWIDWNLCLDATGGPNWAKNFVDSPIIVFPEIDEFIKQPMFYAMGHFSKFIPRGSQRIKVVEHKSIFQSSVDNVAFLTPRNTVTVVLYNSVHQRSVEVRIGDKQATIELEADSVTTLELSPQSKNSKYFSLVV